MFDHAARSQGTLCGVALDEPPGTFAGKQHVGPSAHLGGAEAKLCVGVRLRVGSAEAMRRKVQRVAAVTRSIRTPLESIIAVDRVRHALNDLSEINAGFPVMAAPPELPPVGNGSTPDRETPGSRNGPLGFRVFFLRLESAVLLGIW